MTNEIDNCCLKSVGKKKYPFDFFSKASLKEVNYVKCKKPRIEENPEKKQDLVLSIAIYSNEKKGIKSCSYLVLGSQTLDVLADALYCYNNFSEVSGAKNASYFFIENCFYNKRFISPDDRQQLNSEVNLLIEELKQIAQHQIDPSQKIQELTNQKIKRRNEIVGELKYQENYDEPFSWLIQRNPNKYTAATMETTHFRDLSVKIGAQYLYCHKGDCEHVLIVENVRAFNAIIDNYDSFPVLFYQNKTRRLKCFVCKYLPGRIVTTNDLSMTENPSLFCDVCFSSLHPDDADLTPGQKTYEIHPYFLDA